MGYTSSIQWHLFVFLYSHSFKVMIGVASITHSFRLKTEPTKHVLFIVCALDVGNLLDVHLAAVKSGHVQPIQIRRPSCALRSYHLPRSVLLSYINPHHNIQPLSRAWSGKNEVCPLDNATHHSDLHATSTLTTSRSR